MTFAARNHVVAGAASGGAPFSLTAVHEFGIEPVAVNAVIKVDTDGRVRAYNDTTTIGNWFTPTTGGIGSSYRVRFTRVGDAFTGLTEGVFYALTSARSVTFSAPPNYAGGSLLTIEIAAVGNDTVLFSGTVAVSVSNEYE